MNYYKIINEQNIIGAISSNDFIAYSPSADCYLSASEKTGEYANFQNKLYRDSWMTPYQLYAPHIIATIIQTTQEEYEIIVEALKNEETIRMIIHDEDEVIPNLINPVEEMTLDFIKTSKINETSYQCKKTIENGFDLELRGATRHFSLTTQDQLNLMSLGTMAQTSNEIPYHADGEEVIFYTSEEINQIIAAANAFKTYQTTYYNSLKVYINSLETIEEISAIEYGIEIPEKFKTEVLKALEHK